MPLDFRNTNSLWCSVLAETLRRCGVTHAVVSPGSRSTPLVFAFANHPEIEAIPVLDERSAGFFALGLAKQTGRPVALACTSGTAAANFFPAIIEAQESGAPLLVITADRPPEMRECSSGQTIDQQKLYGAHVNWHHELATPEATLERLRYLRQTAAFACERTTMPERGPVHLNAPFRDPLHPAEDGIAEKLRGHITADFFAHVGNGGQSPSWLASRVTLSAAVRGVIIAGPGADGFDEVAAQTGWPILADALSKMRHGSAGAGIVRVSAYDAILRNETLARRLAPEFVLCVGGWPTSKVLRAWLEKHQPEILMIAPSTRNRDALHGRTRSLMGASTELAFTAGQHPQSDAYRAAWQNAEAAARAALDKNLAAIAGPGLSEPCATWLLAQNLPARTPVFVANSMPVRDVECFWPATDLAFQFFFNRGANGIDGTLSTALGIAHARADNLPAVLLTGDLSLLHDTNGFLVAKHLRGSLTIVLINNNGGGIFEHLPVAKFDPPFEDYFATPQNIDFARLCATYGVEHTLVQDWAQFAKLVSALPASGVRVLEIRTDRKRDTARRKELLSVFCSADFHPA